MVSSILTMQIALPAAVLPTVVPFTEGDLTHNTVLRCTPTSTIPWIIYFLLVSHSLRTQEATSNTVAEKRQILQHQP
jgi:hypothetical protein